MSKHLTIRLTPREAKILHNIVDGALDAGACEDGLTPEENAVLAPTQAADVCPRQSGCGEPPDRKY